MSGSRTRALLSAVPSLWRTSPASLSPRHALNAMGRSASAAMSTSSPTPDKSQQDFPDHVRKFYNWLNQSATWQTRLNVENLTEEEQVIFYQLHKDVRKRFYGLSTKIPENLKGKRILDVGCGTGSLVFILSKLVGPEGSVVGVDMSDDGIRIAKETSDYHMKQWNLDKPNFSFHLGKVEDLTKFGFGNESFDLIVSSAVFAFLVEKEKAFHDIYSLLKPGGQLYMSDTFNEREVPKKQMENKGLWTLSMSGAMQWYQVESMSKEAGFQTPYLGCTAPIRIENDVYRAMLDNVRYASAGWRLYKLDKGGERPASAVTYNGSLSTHPDKIVWDVDTTFPKGEAVEVDAELATILANCYLKDCFTFGAATGNPTTARNQNPFAYLDRIRQEGVLPPFAYKIDDAD